MKFCNGPKANSCVVQTVSSIWVKTYLTSWTRHPKLNWLTGDALDLMTGFFMFGNNLIRTRNPTRCSPNAPDSSFKWAHLSSRSAANCGSLKENRETRESRLMVIMNREGKAAAVACGQDYNTENHKEEMKMFAAPLRPVCVSAWVWIHIRVSTWVCARQILHEITHEERQSRKKTHNPDKDCVRVYHYLTAYQFLFANLNPPGFSHHLGA